MRQENMSLTFTTPFPLTRVRAWVPLLPSCEGFPRRDGGVRIMLPTAVATFPLLLRLRRFSTRRGTLDERSGGARARSARGRRRRHSNDNREIRTDLAPGGDARQRRRLGRGRGAGAGGSGDGSRSRRHRRAATGRHRGARVEAVEEGLVVVLLLTCSFRTFTLDALAEGDKT